VADSQHERVVVDGNHADHGCISPNPNTCTTCTRVAKKRGGGNTQTEEETAKWAEEVSVNWAN
jgi:hypothetical protein